MNLKAFGKDVIRFAKRNSETILMVVGVIGTGATAYYGIKDGMQIGYELAEAISKDEEITTKEKAKIVLKNSKRTLAASGITWAAIISSGVISIKKQKAMARTYAIMSEIGHTYRQKVIDTMGEQKDNIVLGKIAEEEFAKDDLDKVQIIETGHGSVLFKDNFTKQYIRSSVDYIRKMQNKVNEFYKFGEDKVTFGEWCDYAGFEYPAEKIAEFCFPAASGVQFELPACTCPNGEPGFLIFYDVEPMTREEADIYDTNHYVASTYDY